ncbi:MAG: adenosylcobinamide-phosphate synthase CbiB [Bacillota bacterium]|nr:adenosylcobinamide-phosphate synthase CbiB [Bacillota bacterium]
MEEPFVLISALVIAFILDYILGDPRWLPHPVRLIGKAITCLELFFLRFCRAAWSQRVAGAAMTFLIAGSAFIFTVLAINLFFRFHFLLGMVLTVYIFYSMLAMKDMIRHVMDVYKALDRNDLVEARKRVGFIVSRDTADLSEEDVVKAALESLFENTGDGVVAPLFYAALGGAPFVVLYKAVNTLDSMIGYKNERYYYLGWAAARTDDILNFIPARLAALAIMLGGCLCGCSWKKGWAVLLRDRNKHESPNSAWPEAAGAGVMDLRLGGTDYHGGVQVTRPLLNETGRIPHRGDMLPALALFRITSVITLLGALMVVILMFLCRGVLF